MVRLPPRLVGLLWPSPGAPQCLRPGRLDPPPHAQMLLAPLARSTRTTAIPPGSGHRRASAQSGSELLRGVAPRPNQLVAESPQQLAIAHTWFLSSVRSCG